jgi:hypothetical protein
MPSAGKEKTAIAAASEDGQKLLKAWERDEQIELSELFHSAENLMLSDADKANYIVLISGVILFDGSRTRVALFDRVDHQNTKGPSIVVGGPFCGDISMVRERRGVLLNPYYALSEKLGGYLGAFTIELNPSLVCLRTQPDRRYIFVIHFGRLTQEGDEIFPEVELRLRSGDRYLGFFDIHEVIDRIKSKDAPVDVEVAKNILVPAHSGSPEVRIQMPKASRGKVYPRSLRICQREVENFFDVASEDEFTSVVLWSVFDSLGFEDVEIKGHRDKRGEFGADIRMFLPLFVRPIQTRLAFAVQVKAGDINATSGQEHHVNVLLDEIKSALRKSVYDPAVRKERPSDRVLVVTSGNISTDAKRLLEERLGAEEFQRVDWWPRWRVLQAVYSSGLPPACVLEMRQVLARATQTG